MAYATVFFINLIKLFHFCVRPPAYDETLYPLLRTDNGDAGLSIDCNRKDAAETVASSRVERPEQTAVFDGSEAGRRAATWPKGWNEVLA